jgi:hypothetical protein
MIAEQPEGVAASEANGGGKVENAPVTTKVQ